MTDTIAAPATAAGRAGVAIVRVSGPAAARVAVAVAGGLPAPRVASRRWFVDPASGERVDNGLVVWFPAPNSFTGEDVLELHGHGGRAVVAGVLTAVFAVPGVRPAEPGEFTRRAFDTGKLDLTGVEALADLIAADTGSQRRQALRQIGGALAGVAEGWRQEIVRLLAHAEAAIDFVDEDLPEDLGQAAAAAALDLATRIEAALARAATGERLRRGFQVVILGAPNAGKSSLLNALAARDVAIVSAEAGTTRDIVTVELDLAGWPVTLCDTAGVRETVNPIEAEGVRRGLVEAEAADLILRLTRVDAGPPIAVPDGVATLDVTTMVDLAQTVPPGLAVSTVTGAGLPDLLTALEQAAATALDSGSDPVFTRARQQAALTRAAVALRQAAVATLPELAAEDLRVAARAIGSISGRVDVEDLLDLVFAEFCIGK